MTNLRIGVDPDGFPWTHTQTRGSGPKWEDAADSALTAAFIYLHCSAPPPPFPFTFPCPPPVLHSRSAIREYRGGNSRHAPKSSVLHCLHLWMMRDQIRTHAGGGEEERGLWEREEDAVHLFINCKYKWLQPFTPPFPLQTDE